jgi:hypothetical protein
MAHLKPTREERTSIIANIEEVLDSIRPVALVLEVKTSLEELAAGEFCFSERPYGVVEILPRRSLS